MIKIQLNNKIHNLTSQEIQRTSTKYADRVAKNKLNKI